MKIVLNSCYGGFDLSEEFQEATGFKNWIERTDANFIAALEKFGVDKASADYSELTIFDMPENTTDYMIEEYDGLEWVIYVVDGKLNRF